MTEKSARTEWRQYPMLAIAAAPGYATSVLHIYGRGPYIAPIGQSFGWTRTQVTIGGAGWDGRRRRRSSA